MNSSSTRNNEVAFNSVPRKFSPGMESHCSGDHPPSDCENPPFDIMSSGSIFCTQASEIPANSGPNPKPPVYKSLTAQRTTMVKMEEVVDRLLDPYHRNGGRHATAKIPNPYRPSVIQHPNRSDANLTATWCGELRVQNEALVDENACAKEQTLRDLERLTAAGTSHHIRGSYSQQGSDVMVSCTADMRSTLEEDELRVPSYLKHRTRVPMRRMQVPGMRAESDYSFASSNDVSVDFAGLDFATMADYTSLVACRAPPSVCSSEASSLGRAKKPSLKNSKMMKCVKGFKSWRKVPKQTCGLRETPSIREDQGYDFATEPLSLPGSSVMLRGNCFMCLGGAQPTKHSLDEGMPGNQGATPEQPAELRSILLTTSPLYGDVVQPTPRHAVDVTDTQHSLTVTATNNPTTEILSDTESECDVLPREERPITEIWDDDESDRDSAHQSEGPCSLKQWDSSFMSHWVPPTLKTDQEYEMHQLQSRMEAENMVRQRLTRHQMSPVPGQKSMTEELVDTASMSSWDVKTTRDMHVSKRTFSQCSSSWSELAADLPGVTSSKTEAHANHGGLR